MKIDFNRNLNIFTGEYFNTIYFNTFKRNSKYFLLLDIYFIINKSSSGISSGVCELLFKFCISKKCCLHNLVKTKTIDEFVR